MSDQIRVVSFPKSGRTWFTYLYYYYMLAHYGQKELAGAEFNRMRYMNMPTLQPEFVDRIESALARDGLPILSFTHAMGRDEENISFPPTEQRKRLARFKRIIIVRHPAAISWSFFHHARGGKVGYDRSQCEDFHSFLRSKKYGIAKIIKYYNKMIFDKGEPALVLSYEEMMQDAAQVLKRMIEFAGYPVDEAAIAFAVEQSSFTQLRDKERALLARVPGRDPNTAYRFREGRVDSYRDVLKKSDIAYINRLLRGRHNHGLIRQYAPPTPVKRAISLLKLGKRLPAMSGGRPGF